MPEEKVRCQGRASSSVRKKKDCASITSFLASKPYIPTHRSRVWTGTVRIGPAVFGLISCSRPASKRGSIFTHRLTLRTTAQASVFGKWTDASVCGAVVATCPVVRYCCGRDGFNSFDSLRNGGATTLIDRLESSQLRDDTSGQRSRARDESSRARNRVSAGFWHHEDGPILGSAHAMVPCQHFH